MIKGKDLFNFVRSVPFLHIKEADPKRGLIIFKCPVCGEGKSWKSKARGYFAVTKSGGGVFGCHNCGERWSVEEFCEILGLEAPSKGEDVFALSNEIAMAVSTENELSGILGVLDEPDKKPPFGFESIYDSKKALDYVRSRGMSERVYCGWFHRRGNPVIPLVGERCEIFGFQEKVLDDSFPAKYKTLIFSRYKGKYHKIYNYYNKRFGFDEPVYVTEGVFDAGSIMTLGKNAVATLGSSIPSEIMESIGERAVYVPDHDEAGKESAERIKRAFPRISILDYPGEYKDFNEFHLAEPEKALELLTE